jgi:hypothetical protein
MPTYRTYKGARLDLEIYQGKSTIDYPIEVLDASGDAVDMTVYSSIVAKVFYRKHGEEIDTLTVTNSLNVLYLDALKAETLALQTREYWLEIYGILIDPVGEPDLLTFGVLSNV